MEPRQAAGQSEADKGEEEAEEEETEGVGKSRQLLGGDEDQEGQDGPEAVVEQRVEPGQRLEEGRARADDERQPGAELDALDDGDGNDTDGPSEQAGDTQQEDSQAYPLAGTGDDGDGGILVTRDGGGSDGLG